ncbi:protein of unknown function [Shinella sp. WSC3-e]|nr:protein of unknown function [Shinella sp. WSC3-e]
MSERGDIALDGGHLGTFVVLCFHLSVKAPNDWGAVYLLGADEACEFVVNEHS